MPKLTPAEKKPPMPPATGRRRTRFPYLFLGLSALAIPVWGPGRADADRAVSPPSLSSVSVRGSRVTLTLDIPERPAGRFLHLSVDRNRFLGRKVLPGHPLVVCVGHLSAGKHRLGFELAGRDQIVRTDEVLVPVVVPGGPPYSCPSAGQGS